MHYCVFLSESAVGVGTADGAFLAVGVGVASGVTGAVSVGICSAALEAGFASVFAGAFLFESAGAGAVCVAAGKRLNTLDSDEPPAVP